MPPPAPPPPPPPAGWWQRTKAFCYRHSGKMVAAGVLAGAAWGIKHYVETKFAELEEEARHTEANRLRKQELFRRNQITCRQTLLVTLMALREELVVKASMEEYTAKLRSSHVEQLRVWEDIKMACFTRTLAALYSMACLTALVHVQLHIVGGLMFLSTSDAQGQAHDSPSATDQKDFLALAQAFASRGLDDIVDVVQRHVRTVLGDISLQEKLTPEDIPNLFATLRSRIEHSQQVTSWFPGTFPREHPDVASLQLQRLRAELNDVMDSPLFTRTIVECMNFGTRRVSAHIVSQAFKDDAVVAMHLATLLPIVNDEIYFVLANERSLAEDVVGLEAVQSMASTVYASFSEPAAVPL